MFSYGTHNASIITFTKDYVTAQGPSKVYSMHISMLHL